MKKIYSVFLLLAPFLMTSAQQRKGWQLVWSDEFNYTGLPDTTKWTYETGFVRNHEQQYYTQARQENARVNGGYLTLTGRKEVFPNAAHRPGAEGWQQKDSFAQYTSASINTLGKFSLVYGRIEMSAKLPAGQGIWPAFWMLGTDKTVGGWPSIGEIDIMEFIGKEPKRVWGTMHFAHPATGKHASSGGHIDVPNLHDGFHLYAAEWDEQKIDLYFDDSLYHRFYLDSLSTGPGNPFRKPFYLLLNLALGGDWPGPVSDAVLPQTYVVDYVRVYQRKTKAGQ